MNERNLNHLPVLVEEIIELFAPKEGNVIVDGTCGLGGHAKEFCKRIGATGKYIGIDQDQSALSVAKENLEEFKENCILINDNFRNLKLILDNLGVEHVDGILLDLGVSSLQLDDPKRGFSFRFDAALDMRMNSNQSKTAFDIVNGSTEAELSDLLKEYGEERWHKRIARRIVEERLKEPIKTTAQLQDIVSRAMPHSQKRQKIHPATRTFQALRIAVNDELGSLRDFLSDCSDVLSKVGKIGIISFHSLEDRIVKRAFKHFAQTGLVDVLTKKPVCAKEEEIAKNPRARSARLRVAERI